MERIKVRLKNVSGDKRSAIPSYETPGAAGVDLRACLEREIILQSGETVKVPTGWAIQLPDSQVVALVFARSGLAANYGVALANGVG
ncbi:MAG: dUTP diphosphatase, partial [Desulfitobacteriaceae bacterium]